MTALDHLVWAGPDLDSLVATARERLGVEPVEGGPHAGRGTKNFLIGLGEGRYLELVGPDPDQPEPDRPRPFGVSDLTENRVITWAVRATDMAATVARARRLGHEPGEPTAMARTRPDGVRLEWQLTPGVGEHTLDGVVPFVIDWGPTPHPSSGLPTVGLEELVLRCPDPARARRAIDALGVDGDITVTAGETSVTAELSTPQGLVSI